MTPHAPDPSACPECDGYGVLDGLDPCPADCEASRRFVRDHAASDPSERAGEGLTEDEQEALLQARHRGTQTDLARVVERILADRMAARAGEVRDLRAALETGGER